MATSQNSSVQALGGFPAFRHEADADEEARWEAYCALQRRKQRNVPHASAEADFGFGSPRFSSPAFETALAAPDGDIGGAPGRGRKPVLIGAAALLVGGLVAAGVLISQHLGGARPAPIHAAPLAPAAPRLAAVAPSSPSAPAALPAVAPIVAYRPPIAYDRPQHRIGVARSRRHQGTNVIRDRQTSLQTERAEREARDTPFQATMIEPPRRTAVTRERNTDVQPRVAARDSASNERPFAATTLKEYRASQTEYERQLKSYDAAVARYNHRVRTQSPAPITRRAYDSAFAVDAVPWRQ